MQLEKDENCRRLLLSRHLGILPFVVGTVRPAPIHSANVRSPSRPFLQIRATDNMTYTLTFRRRTFYTALSVKRKIREIRIRSRAIYVKPQNAVISALHKDLIVCWASVSLGMHAFRFGFALIICMIHMHIHYLLRTIVALPARRLSRF